MASDDRDGARRFEHQLRRRARRSTTGVTDPELAAILSHVDRRRSQRRASASPATQEPAVGSAQQPEPDGLRGPAGQVLEVDDVAAGVRILRIGRPPGFDFVAGQHAKLGAPGGKTNSYSIASAPHEAHLEFCIELVPAGEVTPALFALRPGDAVQLGDAAKGDFALDDGAGAHLMVATVTGIAPLRSMLRDALHRGRTEPVVVAHGASHADELAYHDELAGLAERTAHLRYEPTVSRPEDPRNVGWPGRTGRVDPLALELAGSFDAASTRAYAAGNPGMVRNVRAQLGALGMAVSTEAF